MYETILVGTDGSDQASTAIDHGIDLASKYGAVLHVIAVVDTSRYGESALSATELVLDDLEDEAQAQLMEALERGRSRGVVVEGVCSHGTPDLEIVGYADEIDADLVLLGTTGRSRDGHHIGSVANRVTKGTDRAVLLS
ncbi:MAG: universal stress protein [Halorientalis sp.]